MKRDPIKILSLSIGVLVIAFLVISGLTPDIIPRDIVLLVGMGIIIGYFVFEAIFLFPEIEQTRESLTKLTDTLGIVELIEDSDRYYALLEEATRNAKKSLRFTYLTTEPPTKLEPRAEVYWKFFIEFAEKKQELLIKRIASIDNQDKLSFLKERTNELRDIKKYGLRYYLPSESPPLPGLEIIDEEQVFFFGPEADIRRYLYVKDKVLAHGIAKYFDDVWDFLGKEGRILKELEETDEDTINNRFSEVEKKLSS